MTFVLRNVEIYFRNIWHLLKSNLVMSVRILSNGNKDSNEKILIIIVTVAR